MKATIGILVFTSLMFTLWAQNGRAGITSDSVRYLDAAQNMALGKGYVTDMARNASGSMIHTGTPRKITEWPPFYSMVLSMVGTTPGAVATVNALCVALSVLLVGAMLHRWRWRVGTTCGTLAMATFSGTLIVAGMAWSESLFMLLITAAVWALTKGHKWLVVGCALTALASLTRWLGIGLLPPVVVAVWLTLGRARWRAALGLTALAVLPVVAVLGYNHLSVGVASATVINAPTHSLGTCVELMLVGLGGWWGFSSPFMAGAVLLTVLMTAWACGDRTVKVAVSVVFGLLVTLAVTSVWIAIGGHATRQIIPLYPLMVIGLVWMCRKSTLGKVLLVGLTVGTVYYGIQTAISIHNAGAAALVNWMW